MLMRAMLCAALFTVLFRGATLGAYAREARCLAPDLAKPWVEAGYSREEILQSTASAAAKPNSSVARIFSASPVRR